MIERSIEHALTDALFKGKVLVVYGARQVGKTTLVKKIAEQHAPYLYLNCDEADVRAALEVQNATALKSLIGPYKLVVIDEAQRVKNIGLTLKIIQENTAVQLIATGSSSFELSNQIQEPLTGRALTFTLFPISIAESLKQQSSLEVNRQLEDYLVFGMYPEVLRSEQFSKETLLISLAESYLFRDLLSYEFIRKPDILEKLLQALALQLGNEVAYTELAQLLGIDKQTVVAYIRLLEQAFIVFRLNPFSRNLRNELKKNRKIYFVDNGIRNAIIKNLNPLSLRNDVGALWENFMISERYKKLHYERLMASSYFWRTHRQQEIDYLEERQGSLHAYELKWKKTSAGFPRAFQDAYPDASFSVISRDNYLDFVG